MAYPAAPPSADHGDRARRQKRLQRSTLRVLLARVERGQCSLIRRGADAETKDAILQGLCARQAGVGEHAGHPSVLNEHLTHELGDAAGARLCREGLKQKGARPFALVCILYEQATSAWVACNRS